MKTLFVVALSAVGALSVAKAQSPLPVSPGRIKPYATVWTVTVTKPDGTRLPQGLWSDEVILGSYKGRPSIRRVQGITYVNGSSATWVNVLDAATLRRMMDIQHTLRGQLITREFSDSSMVSERRQPGETRVDTARTALHGAVYDYLAGSYGLLFAALPLTDDFTATFTSVDEVGDSVRTVNVKVTGRESVNAGGGRTAMAWKVVDGQLTYFVSEQSPYVLKLVETMPDGAVLAWELI